jgi:hypothetical protein
MIHHSGFFISPALKCGAYLLVPDLEVGEIIKP